VSAQILSGAISEPLPLLGKDGRELGLNRRLINIPGAVLLNAPGGAPVSIQPRPFSTFYIYDSQPVGSNNFIEVSPPGKAPTGWFAAEETIEWPNNVSLTSAVPASRIRAPFFKSIETISELAEDESGFAQFVNDLAKTTEELEYAQSVGDQAAVTAAEKLMGDFRSSGVTALESSVVRHWRDQFYLMPVLDYKEGAKDFFTGKSTQMFFQTAVVPLRQEGGRSECSSSDKLGVVFVVDTTSSMQKYIDRTRSIVNAVVDKIFQESNPEHVRFGLVGFRDDPVERPKTLYRTKVFMNLSENSRVNSIVDKLGEMKASEHSTEGFSEDALAGVLTALDMDWSDFRSRWIVLITDASPRLETINQKGNTTNVNDAASLLWDVGSVGLAAIHLQTPEARSAGDVVVAGERLRQLARWNNVDTLYYGIDDGDLDEFGEQIDSVVRKIIGQANEKSDETFRYEQSDDQFEDPIARIGRAQRAVWLGRCDEDVPSIIEGWISDRAQFALSTDKTWSKKEPYSVHPRVLLTRLQLGLFKNSMQSVLDTYASAPELGGESFFDAVADKLLNIMTTNDVIRVDDGDVGEYVSSRDINTLGEMLPSFLELLPVKPDFFTLTRDRWDNMTADQKDNFVTGVRRRIDNIEALLDNPEVWVSLHDDSSEYEYVTPVLIRLLP
jgi:hypothetical protein